MKKVLALVVALLMVCAFAVSAFAEEFVVYNNPEGDDFTDCVNAWDFFGLGGFWGRAAANAFTDIDIEQIKTIINDGGAVFSYTFTGTPGWDGLDPALVFNGEFTDEEGDRRVVHFTVTDLGDGKYEASVNLDDMKANWLAMGKTVEEIDNFLIQTWTANFKLLSAKFATGADATAAAPAPETPAADNTPAPDAVPAATTNDAPKTGLALAVIPAVMALAAVAVSKKH